MLIRKTALLFMAVFFVISMFSGCSSPQASNEEAGEKQNIKNKPEYITITDSMGREVKVLSPLKRVVVVNSDVGELICALGAADKVVGVADTTDFPPVLKEKSKVGHAFEPSVERIIELKPDVVFGYGRFLKEKLQKQIESAGIPVVYLDCYKVKTMTSDIKTLGTILGKEKEAEEYVAFFNKYLKMIEDRVEKVKPEERPLVYLEGYSDYKTVSKGSGGDQLLEKAGGKNIAADEPVPFPEVSPEWVVSKNPQVVIKAVSSRVPSGYGETGEAMKKKRDEIMSRPGWEAIDAVKNGRVYVLSSDIYTSPRTPVGIIYFAKWLYPELFADLDPGAIHREFLKKFHGLELKGSWVYPAG